MPALTQIWISKFALTTGLYATTAEILPGGLAKVSGGHGTFDSCLRGEGLEWHRSREAAIARADELRDARIASLRRQISRLKAIKDWAA